MLIALAFQSDSRVLNLDEPCTGLDPVARELFLEFLNRLSRRPNAPTLVLVTHHVEEITPIFSHALLLRGGTVLASGPIGRSLTSRSLSLLLDHPVRLLRSGGRLSLRVSPGGAA